MKKKKITTKSGAKYVVYEDGSVHREENGPDIVRTVNDYQYSRGFLQPAVSYDDIVEGVRLPWQGVRFDKFTEPIVSTIIVSVEEYES